MRKVLSFVLVLALVLGSFSMAFAATPTDVAGTDYSEAVTVLSGLGVVAGYPDGTYKPAQAVTRAEMAKLIVVALGLEDYAVGTSKFPDMAGATWAQGYVNYASGLGVILGYPDGTFKPSQTVSYDEAVAMIVRALGYTDASLLPATWPANYVVKAKALGILADVTAKAGGADRGDVAIMLYNALPLSFGAISNDTGKWVANSGTDNMLTRLGASEATVTVAPGDVGDEDVTLVDLSAYVYATIHAYKNSDGVIVSVASVHSDVATGELTTADGTVTLADDSDITITPKAISSTPVYFNGGATTYGLVDLEFLDGYDVTVYGTFDAADDTLFATIAGIVAWAPTSVELVATSDVDSIADALVDGNGTVLGVTLPTVDNKNKALDLSKITVVGAATKLADIKKNDVVYVYAAADDYTNAKVKFEVVRNAKDITVTKVSSTYVYDGATSYKVDSFNSGVEASDLTTIGTFALASKYTVYLGNTGKIFAKEYVSGNTELYGAVSAKATRSAIDSTIYEVKMLTADNTFEVYEVDTLALYNALIAHDLVTYEIDKDGILTSVTTTTAVAALGEYSSRTNAIANKFLASDVVVFDISSTTHSDWETTTLSDKQNVTSGSYITNTDGDIAALAFIASTAGSTAGNYFAVNGIGTVKNSSDVTVYQLDGFKNEVAGSPLTATLISSISLTSAPAVWAVTYSGIEVSAVAPVTYTTVVSHTVDSASSVYVKLGTAVYAVASDVLVYVQVYDADDALDSYKVGNMNDVTANDYARIVVNSDNEVELIVLTERADVGNLS